MNEDKPTLYAISLDQLEWLGSAPKSGYEHELNNKGIFCTIDGVRCLVVGGSHVLHFVAIAYDPDNHPPMWFDFEKAHKACQAISDAIGVSIDGEIVRVASHELSLGISIPTYPCEKDYNKIFQQWFSTGFGAVTSELRINHVYLRNTVFPCSGYSIMLRQQNGDDPERKLLIKPHREDWGDEDFAPWFSIVMPMVSMVGGKKPENEYQSEIKY